MRINVTKAESEVSDSLSLLSLSFSLSLSLSHTHTLFSLLSPTDDPLGERQPQMVVEERGECVVGDEVHGVKEAEDACEWMG